VLETSVELGIDRNVYFRNYIEFSGDRSTQGASASLISYDGKIYALTAKHLLTDAMGITPSVKPSKLQDELLTWVLIPNSSLYGTGEIEAIAEITRAHKSSDDFLNDFLLLEVEADPAAIKAKVLPVSNAPVGLGDKVFVIGCPALTPDNSSR
jgi:hypothetical protein